ncbi:MAG: tetratricopeptide repeat protein [Blastocatellia bacterium]|nr:tetratricopeptide repeat protein [Blastocatellia bacterium]
MAIKINRLLFVAVALMIFTSYGCGALFESRATGSPPVPPAAAIPSDSESTQAVVRHLEEKIKLNSEDFVAYNKLAGYYLQFLRETGNTSYLDLASRAARASLDVLPAEQNTGGLAALTQVEIASHRFADAREHARLLTEIEPRKSYPFELLGDALLELGHYEEASSAYSQMEQRGNGVGPQIRLARLALMRGQTDVARKGFEAALALASAQTPAPRETIAWCRWQLGETAFSAGDYETAERHYQDALTVFADYYRALASLGRVRAALGDLPGAIENYQRAINIFPDPAFVAALGDLYSLTGREKESAAEYALVEQIGRLNQSNGALYSRQLALFYADHDIKPEEAYKMAVEEFKARQDIYGADALAWTALKAGRVAEAERSIRDALRLGTQDAKLFYHRGMIARAAGRGQEARDYLKRALALNPQFDPLQASRARRALEDIGKP